MRASSLFVLGCFVLGLAASCEDAAPSSGQPDGNDGAPPAPALDGSTRPDPARDGGTAADAAPDGNAPDGSEPEDACALGNGGCDPLSTCELVGGAVRCGACPAGYSGTGETSCVNVDECAAAPSPCSEEHEACVDSPGAFSCECVSGYARQGAACMDVNECADDERCDPFTQCTNTPGAFTCSACPSPLLGTGETRCVPPPPRVEAFDLPLSRSVSLCATVGQGLPFDFHMGPGDFALRFDDPAVESGNVTLEATIERPVGSNLRVVVTDIGSGQVLDRTDTHFLARGMIFDVDIMLRALHAVASQPGHGAMFLRYCNPMLPACSEVRVRLTIDDGSSVESAACEPAPTLDPASDTGVVALDDVIADFSPTFTVASTPSTTISWLRDGVVKGTAVVGANGQATFTDAIANDVPAPGMHAYSVLHAGATVRSAARLVELRQE